MTADPRHDEDPMREAETPGDAHARKHAAATRDRAHETMTDDPTKAPPSSEPMIPNKTGLGFGMGRTPWLLALALLIVLILILMLA